VFKIKLCTGISDQKNVVLLLAQINTKLRMEVVATFAMKQLECLKGFEADAFPARKKHRKKIFVKISSINFVPEDWNFVKEEAIFQKAELHVDTRASHSNFLAMAPSS
jgi:hypothetical protein